MRNRAKTSETNGRSGHNLFVGRERRRDGGERSNLKSSLLLKDTGSDISSNARNANAVKQLGNPTLPHA